MQYIYDLMEKVANEQLSKDEIDFVVQSIVSLSPENEVYLPQLISILADAGAIEYRSLVEKFLYYPKNLWACVQALRTLCTRWSFTVDYLKEVKMFIQGVTWDDTDEVRIFATGIAGRYLRDTFDRELLELLLEVFDHLGTSTRILEHEDYARALLKTGAYEAIAIAMGKKWYEMPRMREIEGYIQNGQLHCLDLTIIDKARQMICNHGQKTSE